MSTEEIALIGGFIVSGIGALSGVIALLITRDNAKQALRVHQIDRWAQFLEERLRRLIDLRTKVERMGFGPFDEAGINEIAIEIRALVWGIGSEALISEWLQIIENKHKDAGEKVNALENVKNACDAAVLVVGAAIAEYLEVT